MLIKLFITFLKINLLSTSGPASFGITQKLVVPNIITQDKFREIITVTSGMPGSDAIQNAWQVGYSVKGMIGAIIAVIGALIPCILLVYLITIGIRFLNPKILTKFFNGVNPMLAVSLVFTAMNLLSISQIKPIIAIIIILGTLLFYLKIPVTISLILGGLLGVIFL